MRGKNIGLLVILLAAASVSIACSRKPAAPGALGSSSRELFSELGGKTLRVLILPQPLPLGAEDLGDEGIQTQWLGAIAGRVARDLGAEVELRVAESAEKLPEAAFGRADLVVSLIHGDGVEAWRTSARLLPFWPLPGSPVPGPGIAWCAVAPDKPLLAAAAAAALSSALRTGGLATDFDASLGKGAAWRYFASVGYDGILRAQYLDLPDAERAWVEARLASGGSLRAAVREGNTFAYVTQADGSVKGFDHDLLVALANSLGLRLDLVAVKDIAGFFARDGVTPPDLGETDYDYTPDLLKRVDLYANPFGVTPWRQRMMRMITIYPIRNQLAGRRGEEVTAITGLDRKRFAVVRDSVQQKTLEEFAGKRGLRFSFEYGANEDELYDLVREGRADYILDGSVVFALNVDKISDFGLSPFFSELQGVAWATKKDDETLAGVVSSFLDASRNSGLLPALWQRTFRMDYDSYVSAMMAAEEGGQ